MRSCSCMRRRGMGRRWSRNHCTSGRSGRNCRLHRRHDQIGCLARLRNDTARSRLLMRRRGNHRLVSRWCGGRGGGYGLGRCCSDGLRRRRCYLCLGRRRGVSRSSGLLFFALLYSLEHIARLGNARPVNLRFRFFLPLCRGLRGTPTATPQKGAYTVGLVRLNGTGMGLFLGNSAFRQCIQNRSTLNFEFSR